jgi:hypothetical protein
MIHQSYITDTKPFYSGLLKQDLKNQVDGIYCSFNVKSQNVSFIVMIDLHPSTNCYIYNVDVAECFQNTKEYDLP